MEPELPKEYKKGFAKFLGLKIDLSQRPLIPRPETAFWVKAAIREMKKENKKRIGFLDLFSGSGCIGLAVLAKVENAFCDFGDIDPGNIKQIKINIKINGLKGKRPKVIKTDVFSKIKKKYDYLLANPPYIAESRFHLMQPSVRIFEPMISLEAGEDGMFFIDKFLKEAKNFLKPGERFLWNLIFTRKRSWKQCWKNTGGRAIRYIRISLGRRGS